MTRAGRATWAPAGRTLHLVDVENLAEAAHLDEAAVAEQGDSYRSVVDVGAVDHVWIASHPRLAYAARSGWPGARILVGHGPDGADLALLDALAMDDIAERFDEVVVGSGDGVFASTALQLRLLGLQVGVVARAESLSRRLAQAASYVRLLPGREEVAALAAA